MKIKIDGRSFIYPDSDIEWFDTLGNIKYRSVSKIIKSRPTKGDKMEPEDYNNFKKVESNGKITWVIKNNHRKVENVVVNVKKEKLESMIKIKSGGKWHSYPEDQIESWDADGNIKWSDKVHWKFLRGRPQKGDEFDYDNERFIKLYNNITINSFNVDFNYEKFKNIDRNNLIKIDDLTILIKSFMRPDCVNNLLMSIRMKYDIKIVIVDDSETPLNFDYDENIKTHNIEFDSGLSSGRNYGVSKIDTPYFLLCDDDFEFTEKTDLVKWLEIFKNSDLDILGGDVIMNGNRIDYFGLLEKIDDKLYYRHGNHNITEFYTEYDLILNFFITKTKKIKKYKWDDSLKLAEHTAFFFEHKGKLKIAHTKFFSVNHQQVRELEYNNYRNRAKNFFKEWMLRKGVNEVIDFSNRVSYKIN